MDFFFRTMVDLATSREWLVAANVLLAALLGIWIFRNRRLYRITRDEQSNQRDLIENLSEGIYRSSPEGRQLSANKALVKLNGYDTEAELLAAAKNIGKEWYVEPGRRDQFRTILARDGFVKDFVSEIYRHKTRERIWITESARLVRDNNGKTLFYEGSVREITETVNRLKAEELLRKLSSQVPGALVQLVRRTQGAYALSYASNGFRTIFGLQSDEAFGNPRRFLKLVDKADRRAFAKALQASRDTLQPIDMEFRATACDGTSKWLRAGAKPERVDGGVMWHGYVNDISVRKRNEMEIQKLAFFDPLTGLPNRRMFMDRMARSVERCRDRAGCGALLFIDLDNFKTLNDTRGHDVGDEYLVQVAARLKACVRPDDTVARIGGDEFVVILDGVGHDYAHMSRCAIMTANKVLASMRDDFEIGQFKHRSSASLGVVVFDAQDCQPDEILKQADIAMYRAKAAGRNGMALYDHLSMSPESDRYRLLNEFKAALGTEALELHLQPQFDDSGHVVGAEALCRWQHPEYGTLLPERFVPLTEQFGLIREFGNFVLSRGIAQLARWQQDDTTSRLRLAVNVNVQSLSCDDFLSNLAEMLATHGVDPGLLTLELTESVMSADRKYIGKRMHELKTLGVRLSLDDFGSGYSSLAHLKRLPFDELKIDGSFVADIESGESDRALVKSILGTARTLKLTAVAEHVENARQEAFLRAFGCDFFQGYFYSPALPEAAFAAFLRQRRVAAPGTDAERLRQSA
jgi:diguanylate cyclase (GGDEF)-like protein/PAS domain S-box-containing protein